MSDPKYALSHLLVGGAAGWCFYNTYSGGQLQWEWIYGAYGPLYIYSFAGVWMYGTNLDGEDALRLYDYADKLVTTFPLPFYLTDYYLRQGYDWHYAYIDAAIAVIPVGALLVSDDWNQDLVDAIVLVSAAFGCVIAAMNENHFAIAANVNCLINHFVLRTRSFDKVPPNILYNAGLCSFIYLVYRSLEGGSYSFF